MALFTLTSEKVICLLEKLKIPKVFISTAKNFQQQQHKIQVKDAKKTGFSQFSGFISTISDLHFHSN